MTTTTRELKDEEEDEEQRKLELQEAEGEDEDEEADGDFVPDANEVDSADEEFEGDFELDMACEVGGDGKAPAGGAKRKRQPAKGAAGKKAKKPAKVKRGGGITLEDDEDDATAAPAAEDPAEAAAPAVDPKQAEADAKKAAADALWAEMNGGSAPKKPAPKAPSSGLDISSLLAKANAGSGGSGKQVAGGGTVTIKQTMDFCGQEVTVTKQVKTGSQEEIAARELEREAAKKKAGSGGVADVLSKVVAAGSALQRQMGSGPAGGSSGGGLRFLEAGKSDLAFTGKLAASLKAPAPSAPTGLAGLLSQIDGKKKMSTMEKSRHDWSGYKDKQDEHTRDEMDKFAKDGYLEKMAFLARTDDRQAQVARSNRRRGMGLKD